MFKFASSKELLKVVACIVCLFVQGCATPVKEGERVYLYVAENLSITTLGKTFLQHDLVPNFLLKSGADADTPIIIIPQGNVPAIYLKSLMIACANKGLTNTFLRDFGATQVRPPFKLHYEKTP